MDIFKEIIHDTSRILTCIVYIISIYYLCISFFGLWRKKDDKITTRKSSFALIVAAHNEEVVIGDVVDSLMALDYPKQLYDVFVIADNCTDKTAQKARKKGAIVYERFNKDKRGKGYALEWMFNKLFKMNKKYSAVAIFDADNLVHKNFLNAMDKKLNEGYKVVQGYLDSKNPVDTWITGSYSIAFWTNNRMFQLAKSNIGLSTQLGGTGFCVETGILKKLGWGATCLTEDLEFTCKLILNGYKVGWAHDAVIYDEKPLTLPQSWRQRKRWMQGFADVSSRYFFKLVKKAFTSFSFVPLDCALYSIQPIVTVLIGISAIMGFLHHFMSTYNIISNLSEFVYSVDFSVVTVLAIGFSILQCIYTPLILLIERKFSFKVFLYYLLYPLYIMTWFPISILGILNKNNKEWNHTVHTRSVKIKDLRKAN